MYTFYTLTCGVSPFLYVLGMSEFRTKVEELLDDIWVIVHTTVTQVIANIWKKRSRFTCHNNQIQPSGEEILPLDNMENRDDQLPGTSGSGRDERSRESAF